MRCKYCLERHDQYYSNTLWISSSMQSGMLIYQFSITCFVSMKITNYYIIKIPEKFSVTGIKEQKDVSRLFYFLNITRVIILY